MVDVAANGVAPQSREKIAQMLTAPATDGYRATLPLWALGALYGQDRIPQFWIVRDLELMATHPYCRNAMMYFKSGVHGAEFWGGPSPDQNPQGLPFCADNQEVNQFIHDHVQRYWESGMPLVQGGYDYGWIGLEPEYEQDERTSQLRWSGMRQFSPYDCFLLTQKKRPVGVRIKNIQGKGEVGLWLSSPDVPAKGIWYAHEPRYHAWYGQSQYLGAWRPWRRLAYRDGVETVTDMGAYRHAYAGFEVRYPNEDIAVSPSLGNIAGTYQDSQGGVRMHARDMARWMAEQLKTGAGVGIPSEHYPADMGGGPKWEVKHPQSVLNLDPLINYAKDLRDQIYLGIGVPPEMLQSGESGSGYSGRQIPLDAFLTRQQQIANALLNLFLVQILGPLIRWNFGPGIRWQCKVKSLIATKKTNAQTPQQQMAQTQAQGGNQEGSDWNQEQAGVQGQGSPTDQDNAWQPYTNPQTGQSGWRSQGGRTLYQPAPPGAAMAIDSHTERTERVKALANLILGGRAA